MRRETLRDAISPKLFRIRAYRESFDKIASHRVSLSQGRLFEPEPARKPTKYAALVGRRRSRIADYRAKVRTILRAFAPAEEQEGAGVIGSSWTWGCVGAKRPGRT